VGSTFTVLTAASVTGTFSNATIAINGSEHFNVSYTSTGVVLTVASGAAQAGGLAQSSIVAAAVTTREPVLTGELRHGIGPVLRVGGRTSVARMASTPGPSIAILAGRFALSRFEKTSRLPAQVAAWHALSVAPPPTRFASSLERVRRGVPQSSNWNVPLRGASSLRMPATEMFTRRTPVKLSPPMVPRLGR
jgi:hypothetical protein